MNYYIQGSDARAEQIKAAFEKLGYRSSYVFNAEMTLYFTFNGEIKTAVANSYKSIIKTHPDYKELELPVEPKFKVGVWLYHNTCGVHPILVKGYDELRGYKVECIEEIYYLKKNVVEKEYHLWTIKDAKDGDVLSYQGEVFITRIARGLSANVAIDYDCCYDGNSFILDSFYSLTMDELKEVYPATKQQRDLLFKKMKESGYQWDVDKKELRKIKPHYDIANFKPIQWVLVRNCDNQVWGLSMFSHRDMGCYICLNREDFTQCIPFEGNEHLLGTIDPCDEQYINW